MSYETLNGFRDDLRAGSLVYFHSTEGTDEAVVASIRADGEMVVWLGQDVYEEWNANECEQMPTREELEEHYAPEPLLPEESAPMSDIWELRRRFLDRVSNATGVAA